MPLKNKYGQYFTISLIADFMVKLIGHSQTSGILEPSCGKGVFIEHLQKHNFTNITAYEIDKTLSVKCDFIIYRSFLSVPTSEKYDVVIGNPPYIRWKNIEYELKAELEQNTLWKRYFNSLCDYLFIFILKSIEHLNENGELIFICSDYWMNTTHSSTLRNYMCQNGYFTEIYHFKEAPLFEKVTASFIIFRYIKSKKQRGKTIKLYKYNKPKGLPTEKELDERSCFNLMEIPQFKENGRWLLATQQEQDKLEYFVKSCQKESNLFQNGEAYHIGEFCDIGNGMVSGLDKAFRYQNIDELNSAERKCIISVLKAKDLCPYKHKDTTNYIFIQEKITDEEFKSKYPHFFAHFTPYMEELSERYSYNRVIPYWEFVFPRNQKLFEKKQPRIFVPCKERISNKDYFRFSYANADCYSTQDVTAILKKDNTKESLEYILAYLNNERIFNWLLYNGIIKGAIVEFSEAPIASIPFRTINWQNQQEIEIHDEITKTVKMFLKNPLPIHLGAINQSFNKLFNDGFQPNH